MRLHIKQCTYCPRNPDCEHKKALQGAARKILPNITASHRCKEYGLLFQERDEVVVSLMSRSEESPYKMTKLLKKVRGVVIEVSKRGYYIVAFFDPVNIDHVDDEAHNGRAFNILPVRANQIHKTGTYEGESFWDNLQHGDINKESI